MPHIKLYYLEYPFWRADVPRLSLQLANVNNIYEEFFGWISSQVPFEYVVVPQADLSTLIEAGKAPLGQVPSLEVDGKIFCQSGAIARYCGKLAGLYPRHEDLQAAKGWKRIKQDNFSFLSFPR